LLDIAPSAAQAWQRSRLPIIALPQRQHVALNFPTTPALAEDAGTALADRVSP
jgi:hypothetical protein